MLEIKMHNIFFMKFNHPDQYLIASSLNKSFIYLLRRKMLLIPKIRAHIKMRHKYC